MPEILCRSSIREIFTEVWGMTSVLIAALRTTLFSSFDQNLAENLATPPHSTFQQSWTER